MNNFQDQLQELLSISKSIVDKYNIKNFDYLKYQFSFSVLFNIRFKLYDLDYDKNKFQTKIDELDLYFKELFNSYDFKNIQTRESFYYSKTSTISSFPIMVPESLWKNTIWYTEYQTLSDKQTNELTFNKIKKDFKNGLNFYNDKHWKFRFIKFFYFIYLSIIFIAFIATSLLSLILQFSNTYLIYHIPIILSSITSLIFPMYIIYQMKNKNYQRYVPIFFALTRTCESSYVTKFSSINSYIRHVMNIFVMILPYIFASLYIWININNLLFSWYFWLYISLCLMTILLIVFTFYINSEKTKINYNLIIELYNKYYYEISNEIRTIS